MSDLELLKSFATRYIERSEYQQPSYSLLDDQIQEMLIRCNKQGMITRFATIQYILKYCDLVEQYPHIVGIRIKASEYLSKIDTTFNKYVSGNDLVATEEIITSFAVRLIKYVDRLTELDYH